MAGAVCGAPGRGVLEWLCLCVALLQLAGCRAAAERPNLVLVVVDNLRADHLGFHGYGRRTSPHLDALAREASWFARATAPSSWTRPSVASLFTSRLPSEHGAVRVQEPLSPALPTVAERLRAAGYLTIGVSANYVSVSDDSGLGRGFERWTSFSVPAAAGEPDLWSQTSAGGKLVRTRAPRGSELNARLLAQLPARVDRPLFLYVHYMEPHAPYDPPARFLEPVARASEAAGVPFATTELLVDLAAGRRAADAEMRRRIVSLYDGEVAAADAAVGQLLAALRQRGVLDDALVVLTADHGEEFAEHGAWFHGLQLHRESLHVPLVLWRDGRPGSRRDEPADLLDVPTTLLAVAGLEPSPGMRGRDLTRASLPSRPELVAELHPDALFADRVRARSHRLAVLRFPWKAIVGRDGDVLVFRTDRDPGERTPVPDAERPADLAGHALRLAQSLDAVLPEQGSAELDAQTREGLRALGYAE